MLSQFELLQSVLEASERLLLARASGAISATDWNALGAAVESCRARPSGSLGDSFSVAHGSLVRRARTNDGRSYVNTCPRESFEAIARAIEPTRGVGVTIRILQATTGLNAAQIATALAFLRERGVIEPGYPRRSFPTSATTYTDALAAYHALREGQGA